MEDRLIAIADGKVDVLPDCRAKEPKGVIDHNPYGSPLIPCFCSNCGKREGFVTASMTFAFALCDECVKKHGHPANTMVAPDQVTWAKLQAEDEERQRKNPLITERTA